MGTPDFPVLYPILDSSFLPASGDLRRSKLQSLVRALADAGVSMLQYRNKQGGPGEILADAVAMRAAAGPGLKLILNDWPSLAVQAEFDGVHVGQHDLSPAAARAIVGPGRIVGISTHHRAQLLAAEREPVDYIAIGPVFATSSKQNPDPVVGLEGVSVARGIVSKPLVAIGGITLATAADVRRAGADSVAVISAIFSAQGDAARLAGEFLRVLQ